VQWVRSVLEDVWGYAGGMGSFRAPGVEDTGAVGFVPLGIIGTRGMGSFLRAGRLRVGQRHGFVPAILLRILHGAGAMGSFQADRADGVARIGFVLCRWG